MTPWKIPLTRFEITEEHRKVTNEILDSTRFTEGEWVKTFEQAMAEYIGVKHCIACANGTAALMLVFHALRAKYNRVIVPALTFPATLNAALLTGYDACLKDCSDHDPFLIDATGLDRALPTDIVVPVHLLGYPVKMEPIIELSKKKGFAVVTDSCEAVISSYNYQKVGNMGEIASCFSFYPTHQIAAGEMGCVTTNDDNLDKFIRSIKNHGRTGSNLEFKHSYVGYNFKALEICAAFAYIQLNQIDEIIKARYNNIKTLNKLIKNKDLILPEAKASVSYLCYSLGSKTGKEKYTKALNEAGIETRTMFPCLANQKAYEGFWFHKFKYENANNYEKNYFYITCHQSLTAEEIKLIADTLNKMAK